MARRRRRLDIVLFAAAAAVAFAACSGARSTPSAGEPAQVVQHGGPDRMVVALTFDAGYEKTYTDQILDILGQEDVKASFGITGVWAVDYPDLLRRISDDGHDVFNHSYHHWSFTGQSAQNAPLTEAQIWDELDAADAAIKKVTGVSTKPYFRPPYGDSSDAVNTAAAAHGYRYSVMWSVSSLGRLGGPTEAIVQRVLSTVQPGAIIAFHLGVAEDAYALQPIIDGLRGMGYGFVTVPQIVAAGGAAP